jgi:hypothetical protein
MVLLLGNADAQPRKMKGGKKMKQKNLEGNTAWEDVESPNFFQFKNIGDKVEGELVGKDKSSQYGFGLYSLKTSDEEQIRFHGSSQLDDLMLGVDIGEYILIEYIDIQKRPKGDMKLFRVKRKR